MEEVVVGFAFSVKSFLFCLNFCVFDIQTTGENISPFWAAKYRVSVNVPQNDAPGAFLNEPGRAFVF